MPFGFIPCLDLNIALVTQWDLYGLDLRKAGLARDNEPTVGRPAAMDSIDMT